MRVAVPPRMLCESAFLMASPMAPRMTCRAAARPSRLWPVVHARRLRPARCTAPACRLSVPPSPPSAATPGGRTARRPMSRRHVPARFARISPAITKSGARTSAPAPNPPACARCRRSPPCRTRVTEALAGFRRPCAAHRVFCRPRHRAHQKTTSRALPCDVFSGIFPSRENAGSSPVPTKPDFTRLCAPAATISWCFRPGFFPGISISIYR